MLEIRCIAYFLPKNVEFAPEIAYTFQLVDVISDVNYFRISETIFYTIRREES